MLWGQLSPIGILAVKVQWRSYCYFLSPSACVVLWSHHLLPFFGVGLITHTSPVSFYRLAISWQRLLAMDDGYRHRRVTGAVVYDSGLSNYQNKLCGDL